MLYAEVLIAGGDSDLARETLEETLDRLRRVLGEDHPYTRQAGELLQRLTQ